MPTVHLICGSTGAGKTTHAIALAQQTGGVRFSIDEWMASLYVKDWPPNAEVGWALERIARIETQIWKLAQQLLPRGFDVILDLGLSKREHREKFRVLAREAGVPVKLHFLDVDAATRLQRVHQRNAEKKEAFAFEVTDQMFDFMEGWFERPGPDEL